jgi:cell division protein FtsB
VTERRRGLGFLGFSGLVLVVVIAGGLAGVFPFRQIIAGERAVELSRQKLEALVEENRRLEQEIAALQTREEVERMAREDFGLVMPGEIGYVAVPGPGRGPATDPGDAGDEGSGQAWWRSLWDFLTGRDLLEDG